MASATRIVVRAEDKGLWRGKQDDESAKKVSALLQEDLEACGDSRHDQSRRAMENLTEMLIQTRNTMSTTAPLAITIITGASPSTIQAAYDANKTYQAAYIPARPSVVAELQGDWPAHAPKYLGRDSHYSDFLKFFQDEIDQRGWEAVVNEFLCADTPKSRDLVQRLFSGVAHPMIQLSFGLEWEQPAIMASGLAQAAVHGNPLKSFFDLVDEAARKADQAGVAEHRVGLSDTCENLRSTHDELSRTATWHDGDGRLYNAVLGRDRGLASAVALCAQMRVREQDLDERTAETLHHAAYVVASTSWKPPYIPKFDFFLIHCLNSSMFLLALDKKKKCIPTSTRVRLTEHKMRYDIVQYIARGVPPLSPSHVRNYAVEHVASRPEDLLPRYHAVVDDGHLVKVARSLLLAQQVSRPWKGKDWIRLVSDEDWINAHHMLLRGVEGQETLWVRSCGFDEAWEGFPKL
ncbi:hypothetical protein NOR_00578 [Metarhizium rileyi]|uniref:HypA-like protein n=1 Tax=Metarhizium rileyi (strain RCEF 4871) TaxID=1649241 RepID=A0A162I3W1_METRR|nr:hypothetical protein NOR_00578 [Metarhizium rileyi RCEF 4871]